MILLFSGLRIVAHHWGVHLLWFHVIELVEVLALLFFGLILMLLIQLNRNFLLRLIVRFLLFLLFLSLFSLATFLNWTFWMIPIFMQSDYILVVGNLSQSGEHVSMLSGLGLVAHHRLVHLLWLHIVELVQVLPFLLLLFLRSHIFILLFWLLFMIINLVLCLLWVMFMTLDFNILSSVFFS